MDAALHNMYIRNALYTSYTMHLRMIRELIDSICMMWSDELPERTEHIFVRELNGSPGMVLVMQPIESIPDLLNIRIQKVDGLKWARMSKETLCDLMEAATATHGTLAEIESGLIALKLKGWAEPGPVPM